MRMPTTTTNTPLIADVTLAARLQDYISGLSNPAKLDPTRELQQIAEDQGLDMGRVLGKFAKQCLDGNSSQPATMTEFFEHLSRFTTQGIADHSKRVGDFELRVIDGFRSHAALSLTTSRSFRPGALRITYGTLDSLLQLIDELNATRALLVQENGSLQKDFVDSDCNIIHAHDHLHTIGNAFTKIRGFAQILGRMISSEKQDEKRVNEYLTALQASISTMIHALLATDAPPLTEDPIKLFSRTNPQVKVIIEGGTPKYLNDEHPLLIKTALDHLTRNAYEAGATEVWVKAEYQPSDPAFAIAIEDNGPGMPEGLPQKLMNGEAGSGWRILREVTLRRLSATYNIQSPFQNAPQPHGTLVMLFIPVQARTGDEPSTGRARRADSGPLPARRDIKTPPHALPAIPKPASSSVGLDPNLAGGVSCFSDKSTGVLLKFPNLR
jgi:hypothetical protein